MQRLLSAEGCIGFSLLKGELPHSCCDTAKEEGTDDTDSNRVEEEECMHIAQTPSEVAPMVEGPDALKQEHQHRLERVR